MIWLNYNHFYYFWVIAKEMSVTRAAKKLRLSQSTLSEQLSQFESLIGQELFVREKQRLKLSETGKVAFDYAERIFLAGEEMVGVFQGKDDKARTITLKMGAVGPLSKNLQYEFVKPILRNKEVKIVANASPLKSLLASLSRHEIDVVLSGYPARNEEGDTFHNDFLGEVKVCIVGKPPLKKFTRKFPYGLEGVPLFVPTKESRMRAEFDTIMDRARVQPYIKAEVEDMALLRVFALSGEAYALVPEIVVSNELKDKRLSIIERVPHLTERFYAITVHRKFAHPLVSQLIKDFSSQLKLRS
jgi:LysR family transcriptional activator of nhaA